MDEDVSADLVASFPDLHLRLSRFVEGWIFRGQSNPAWRLIPKAGREPYVRHEKALFDAWKRQAVEHLSPHFTSDWDWLAIAQHHGLATRLLDWTTNPLNAAYFAVREPGDGPAVIHAAKFANATDPSAVVNDPLNSTGVTVFRPRGIVPRIVRQGGLFTVHGPPEKSLESLAAEELATLERVVIADSYRTKLLVELARYGISSASLFPDLDGLASYLNGTVGSKDALD